MTGENSNRRPVLARLCITSDHGALQGIAKPRTKALLRGAVVVQILVKRSGNSVLHSRTHNVGGETRTESLTESGDSSAIILRVITELSDACSGHYTSRSPLSEALVPPVLPVRVRSSIGCRCTEHRACQDDGDNHELDDPAHASLVAISGPDRRK